MVKKLQNFVMTLLTSGALLFPTLAPVTVMAQESDTIKGLCQGIELNPAGVCQAPGDSDTKIQTVLRTIIDIFSLVVGFAAVLMIIIGGFKYITAGGDAGNVTSAKNTILYAVVGLVIVALAQFIVRFVLGKVT